MHEGHRNRMMEKVLDNCAMLSDHEVLEVLLFYAIPRKNVNHIAHSLIENFGSLKNVFKADATSLMAVEGVGKRTAAYIVSLADCMDRIYDEQTKLPEIYSLESCSRQLINTFKNENEEKFLALYLDRNGKILLRKIFSSHSPYMVDIDLSELLKGVIVKKPASVVICHNHLSGNANPSFSDDKSTEKICIMLRLSKVALLDHIIVANNTIYSYKQSGQLDKIINNAELLL